MLILIVYVANRNLNLLDKVSELFYLYDDFKEFPRKKSYLKLYDIKLRHINTLTFAKVVQFVGG